MLPSRFLLCLALSLLSLGYASPESTDEKTTEAVVKAVVQAESKPESKDAKDSKEAHKNKEAAAVAKATKEVLNTESHVDEFVDTRVIDKATDTAKKTYKELADSGVDSKAAAAAASEVAVATVDGATDLSLPQQTKDNAEKAAVAAGAAVADHPNSQAKALQEAITRVKKEEKTSGKVNLAQPAKGMVAKAKAAVSNLPHLAEGAVATGAKTVEDMGPTGSAIGVFCVLGALAAGAFVARKAYAAHFEASPYMKRLQLIREEFSGAPADSPDLETQYSGFQEFSEMKGIHS
jgi:hypothetical protein